MSQNAIGELPCHDFGACWPIVKGRDEGEDSRSGIGGPVHIADVDFIEGSLADTEHKRALLLEADVSRALNQVRGDAIGNAGQGADAAGDHDHAVTRIRATGDIGADISVCLLLDLAGLVPEQLLDEVIAAGDAEFFGHDAQGAVGSDEVHNGNMLVTLDREQKLLEEQGTAGAGGRNGEISARDRFRVPGWMCSLGQVLVS